MPDVCLTHTVVHTIFNIILIIRVMSRYDEIQFVIVLCLRVCLFLIASSSYPFINKMTERICSTSENMSDSESTTLFIKHIGRHVRSIVARICVRINWIIQ